MAYGGSGRKGFLISLAAVAASSQGHRPVYVPKGNLALLPVPNHKTFAAVLGK